jgi:hypothetical protein
VSKNLYPLVIPHLYNTLVVGPRPRELYDYLRTRYDDEEEQKSRETQWSDFRTLIRRLVDNPNPEQASAVREVEVVGFHNGENHFATDLEQKDALAMLVNALPNLQQFRFVSPRRSARRLFTHY